MKKVLKTHQKYICLLQSSIWLLNRYFELTHSYAFPQYNKATLTVVMWREGINYFMYYCTVGPNISKIQVGAPLGAGTRRDFF